MILAFFTGGIGPTELLVVGVVAVLLFGSRLPSVARSAGKSLTEFKRGMHDLQSDFRRSMDVEETLRQDAPTAAVAGPTTEADPSEGVNDQGYDDSDTLPVADPEAADSPAEEPAEPDEAEARSPSA